MGTRAQAIVAIEEGESPLFLRIARGIADDVRRGRLRTGTALPGSRALADSLGVHRNTVLAAYRELTAEGWVEPRPGGGTFVTGGVPEPKPRALARAPRPSSIARAPGFGLRAEVAPHTRPWGRTRAGRS